MAVKFISVKCPECGANLDIEEDRKTVYCSYCGRKILLHNENEHVYRYIDEAEIKQAEARLREVELAEKQYADAEKKLAAAKKRDALLVKIIIIGVVLLFVGGALTKIPDSSIGDTVMIIAIELILWPVIYFLFRFSKKK